MKQACSMLALAAALVSVAPLGSAATTTYKATLSGPAEATPNTSPATGLATVVIDDAAHTMHLNTSFSGLLGTSTAAHIHCCTSAPLTGAAPVASTVPAFAGFPLGVVDGAYDTVLDLLAPGTYNPAFVTANGGTPAGAESALLSGLSTGQAYLNIHTTAFAAGEVRGFLSPVPEPSSLAMLSLGIAAIGLVRRRRA